MKTVSDIGERGLIKIISEILGGLGNEILSGEDDAVAFKIKDPSTLVVNTDMLVSTTDVPSQMTLFQAARKAVVMTVSDILVKGAIPKWAVIGLGIPKHLIIDGDQGFSGIIHGLKEGFNEYGVKYLGGDLNESKEIIISCTIFGDAPYGIIPRSGAKPGDLILCTGEMGKTGCGFSILLDKKTSNSITETQKTHFVESVLNPSTPKNHGQIFAKKKWATASCDSSDGVLTSLKEICKVSIVGAELDWDSLPIAEGVEEFSNDTKQSLIDLILNSGEEFIHIFTIHNEVVNDLQNYCKNNRLTYYQIGTITENEEIFLNIDNGRVNISEKFGFEHFRKKE